MRLWVDFVVLVLWEVDWVEEVGCMVSGLDKVESVVF